MNHTMIRVKQQLADELRSYSKQTGVPIVRIADEALWKWLAEVGRHRLKALQENKQK